jgi:LacI family transcriptional regulator, galactose operon repressor
MARRARATMSEIAAAAGVSVPTVSKVVNGRPDVAPATRRTIEGLLHKHGYTAVRSRSTTRQGLIELVFIDLGSPWAMAILAGVEEVTSRAGTGVVVSAIHGRHRTRPDERWLETVAARRSDGVLLVLSELSPGQQARLDALGVPVVMVDPAGNPTPSSRSVGATNWSGGLAAAEHLIELGHRRIAVIGGPTDVLCSRARIDGYRAAMGAAGLAIPDGYLRYGDFLSASGYQQTIALLNLSEPPTAIFVCSDQMALGAYEALYERGLRVPDDVSIVGFDDLDEARWAIPPLTTVRQPLTEMASMATQMLLALINGEELETTRVELATPLVVRASTGPPKD